MSTRSSQRPNHSVHLLYANSENEGVQAGRIGALARHTGPFLLQRGVL